MFELSLSRFDEKNKLCVYGRCGECSWDTGSGSSDVTKIFLLGKQDQFVVCLELDETNNSGGNDPQAIACYRCDSGYNQLGGDDFRDSKITKKACLDFCRRGRFSYAGLGLERNTETEGNL